MVYEDDVYLTHSISNTVKEFLGIDINNSEYSETCYGFENLKSYQDDNDKFHQKISGFIGIIRNGFLLYWLHFNYEFSEDLENVTKCSAEVKEAFPEHLELFGMEIKNPVLD